MPFFRGAAWPPSKSVLTIVLICPIRYDTIFHGIFTLLLLELKKKDHWK
jgi:hypothetical protein